jgi:hypothetical protein
MHRPPEGEPLATLSVHCNHELTQEGAALAYWLHARESGSRSEAASSPHRALRAWNFPDRGEETGAGLEPSRFTVAAHSSRLWHAGRALRHIDSRRRVSSFRKKKW